MFGSRNRFVLLSASMLFVLATLARGDMDGSGSGSGTNNMRNMSSGGGPDGSGDGSGDGCNSIPGANDQEFVCRLFDTSKLLHIEIKFREVKCDECPLKKAITEVVGKDNGVTVCVTVQQGSTTTGCTVLLVVMKDAKASLEQTNRVLSEVLSLLKNISLSELEDFEINIVNLQPSSSSNKLLGLELWLGCLVIAVAALAIIGICIILGVMFGIICRKLLKPAKPSSRISSLHELSSHLAQSKENLVAFEAETSKASPTSSRPLSALQLQQAAKNCSAINKEYETFPKLKSPLVMGQEDYSTTSFSQAQQPGTPHGYHVNANYIKGFETSDQNYYMATQTPQPNNVNDFWRMVWEQQATAILMIEHDPERVYWPNSSEAVRQDYGNITVAIRKRIIKPQYTVTTFKLYREDSHTEVEHFWYRNWSSAQIPEDTSAVIACLEEIGDRQKTRPGPIVVHCSDGIGCSGTMIAIDLCRQQLQNQQSVDVAMTVSMIRQDKVGMVATKQQYGFIYKVLNDLATHLDVTVLKSKNMTTGSTENLVPI